MHDQLDSRPRGCVRHRRGTALAAALALAIATLAGCGGAGGASSAMRRRERDALATQSEQRAAIVEWRTGLTVLAHRVSLALPPDLQQAGRGEIAPSPGGS
jgi:hypothetical protein